MSDLDPDRYQRVRPTDAIAYLEQKVSLPSEGWRDYEDMEHDAVFVVAGAKGAILTEIRNLVERTLDEGGGLDDFRRGFDGISQRWAHEGGKDWRARLIWMTNASQAYAAGRYAHQLDPEVLQVQPYLQFIHSDHANFRPHHKALDGKVFRANELPFYPPNGFGCGCRTVSVSDRQVKTEGLEISNLRRGDVVEVEDYKGRLVRATLEPDQGFDAIPGRATLEQRVEMLQAAVDRMPPQIARYVTQDVRQQMANMGVYVRGLARNG